MTDVPGLLKRVTDLLSGCGVDYAILGGYAVRSYGIPRPTYDLDLVLGCGREILPGLLRRFDESGFSVSEPFLNGWVDSVAAMPLVRIGWIDDRGNFEVDLFLAEAPFQQMLLQRARQSDVEGWPLRIVSPEDLILLKSLADRPRDRIDVADILFTQSPVDEAHLLTWGRRLGIEDRIHRALHEHHNSESP